MNGQRTSRSWSLKLLTVRGIPIRVHASFLLILLWAAFLGWNGGRGLWARNIGFMVLFTLLLFVCVVFHELGHSIVAQLFGVPVQDITLWPIGGVARIGIMPERPHQEFLIAAAGPATSFVLALILALVAAALIGPGELVRLFEQPWRLQRLTASMTGQSLILLLALNNLLLALFNLIPAFPMDGGRVMRALLAVLLPYGRATRVASFVGQGLAIALGIVAILTGTFFLAIVALFIFAGAWQERQQQTTNDGLRGLRVCQVMQPIGVRLHPLLTTGDAVAQVVALAQSAFVVVDAGRLLGILTRADLLVAVRRAGPATRLTQLVARDYLRVGPNDLLLDTQESLQRYGAAVVIEDGRAVGIVTRSDVIRAAEAMEIYPQALPRG
jgi:Zn-dependent protease/predicted transcriptional regulator